MESEALRPFREAAGRSDRDGYGFGPFPTEGDVRLEEGKAESTGYEILLHVGGKRLLREVAFIRDNSGAYRWIGEQEVHEGPREYDTEDGRHREFVAITYAEKAMRGWPQGSQVEYRGPDAALMTQNLSVEDARALIERWASEQR